MSFLPHVVVRLITPDGEIHDVTARVGENALGRLTEEVESDLLQITHSDLDVTFFDDDGWVSGQFSDCDRGDVYELVIERETGRRRPRYERLFGGVADIPSSVRIRRSEREVAVTFYSYGKLLELYSAESLARSVAGRTGTASASSPTTTLSDSTDLMAGDRIKLETAGGAAEERTILSVDSPTQVTVTEDWTSSFTSAPLTLLTPYPRSQPVTDLAAALFGLAGLEAPNVDIAQELASDPFPSSLGTTGLPVSTPNGVLETGGDIKVYTGGKRYAAADLDSGFTDQGADTAKMDWRPYDATSTAPGTLRAGTDNGTRATDPATGDYYELVAGATTLVLNKNGVALVTVRTKTSNDVWAFYGLDWCPQLSEIWVGYVLDVYDVSDEYASTAIECKRYNAAGVLQGEVAGGLPRSVRVRGYMAVRTFTAYGVAGADPDNRDSGVALYDVSGAGPAIVRTLPAADGLIIWTLRALDTERLLAVSQPTGGGTLVNVWHDADGTLAVQHAISGAQSSVNVATVFDEGGAATPAYVVYGGGVWAVLSTEFAGVVPYADFDGLSAAGALRELAIITGSHFSVDEYASGLLVGRNSQTLSARDPVTIGQPLGSPAEMPVWEWLRRSVVVTGKDEAGGDIEGRAGISGDSASRLEVSTQIPLTQGLADALAAAYYSALGTRRRQLDETIEEPASRPVRVLDVVERDGYRWTALRVETNAREREQTVQLAEEVA